MGISATDIKLRKSQRLTDFPDGGARMVAAEVVDGQLNNLFPDISTQDRVAGRVSMRKAFVHVDTANTDTLYGAVGVIVDPPEDANVSMTMFSTGSYADTRTDARNRIESYVIKGVESRYVLYGDHFIGQRSITVYCMADAPTPEINETYCLSVEKLGYPADVQYVRVESVVSRTTQSFVDSGSDGGAFARDVIVIGITTSLIHDFQGQEVSRYTNIKPPTRVRQTTVADASQYAGIKPLVEDPALGATQVKVADPYVHLVPTTQAETPFVDVLAGQGTLACIQAGDAGDLTLAFSASFTAGAGVTRYFGGPVTRGGVQVTAGGTLLEDDGRGGLASGSASVWSGQIDYLSGAVTLSNSAGAGTTAISAVATAAGPVLQQGYTGSVDITALNRQLNYIMQLTPLPHPGTVNVDYMALGKWIRLSDNSLGQLTAGAGQGSGSVSYATGSLVVTLGALPDVNSKVIVSYGTGLSVARRDDDPLLIAPELVLPLPEISGYPAAQPGTVSVGYTVGGVSKAATDTATPGVLNDGVADVGLVDFAAGHALLRVPMLPDATTSITVAASAVNPQSGVYTPAIDGSGLGNLALDANVVPGSVRIIWTGMRITGYVPPGLAVTSPAQLVAVDDGVGNIVGVSVGGAAFTATIGSIVYATGVVTVQLSGLLANSMDIPLYTWNPDYTLDGYTNTGGGVSVASGSPVSAFWQVAGAASDSGTVTYAADNAVSLGLDLTPGTTSNIVPGSVRFTLQGATYVDRAGVLYRSIDPVTNAGVASGQINYGTGRAEVNGYTNGGATALEVTSLLVQLSAPGQSAITFRTPGAPLRPASLVLRATTLDGVLLTATSDSSGNIVGTRVMGAIDWRTGAAKVRFGELVTAAGHESEDWFDPAQVVGGQIFMPTLVDPATVFVGAVVYRNIPLNPDLLGLDPVRLPEDGRVVVFRPGQTLLIHHTQETSVASPAAGQVVNLGRPDLTRVEVRDSAGTPILSSWYAVDKTGGSVTFSDPLNLTGYTLPVVIRDRIEDRVLCADSQITGEIAINRGLSHDYPAGSYLSTCLILGEKNGSQDLQARVENIFDQRTWTAVFSEERIGDGTDAQYNDVVYPVAVDNGNAITERWAIHFTSASNIEVIGEASGIIWSGNISTDCAPLNPRTGQPYFTIPAAGWGSGWGTDNVLRFNTVGGLAPVWFIRTVLAGEATAPYDGFRYETIGDANP